MSSSIGFKPDSPIPYGCQTLGADDIEAVIRVLQSPYLTQGPLIEAFEKAMAEYCRVPYAVAFCNGTAALHAAYHAAGLGPGDEAITSPITFVATSNAMLYQQARPVFADIDPHTWNLDADAVAAKISTHTKALVPVHFAGQPVELDAYYVLAEQHNLMVIEDACHALGAVYHGKPIGQCRDMAVFSFHPVKSLTTGEGGMVVTPHRHVYEKLLAFRSHGITKQAQQFKMLAGEPWEYEMQTLGYNFRMTDIHAALGITQLPKLNGFIANRQRLAERYREAFRDFAPIGMQQPLPHTSSAHHLFPVVIRPEHTQVTRRQLFDTLVSHDIRPQIHYIPVHWQPYYQEHLGTHKGDFPQAEAYYEHCITLPLYPTLTDEEQDYIIHHVKNCLG